MYIKYIPQTEYYLSADQISRVYSSKHICVIGPPGSGKTTLSRKLSTMLGMPVKQMDDIRFEYINKHEDIPKEEDWLRELDSILEQVPLITDGFYHKSISPRFKSADVIIYFDRNRFYCLISAFRRALLNLIGIHTTAHPATRVSILTNLIYCFGPRLYLSILRFKPKYHQDLLEKFHKMKHQKLILQIHSRNDANHLIENLKQGLPASLNKPNLCL